MYKVFRENKGAYDAQILQLMFFYISLLLRLSGICEENRPEKLKNI